ncbi:MAG: hypothetical protein M1120_00970 [Patescibacteria group bacterium]|nr:hypothetical protein [Patescibacteria group bacterium]
MNKEAGNILGDFDGTFTFNSPVYIENFTALFAKLCSLNQNYTHDLMAAAGQEILKNPGEYGWEINGIIVAPAADIILFSQACAKLVIDSLRAENYKNLPDQNETDAFLNQLYGYAYKRTPALFKPDAIDALKRLSSSRKFVVVTNSSTGSVRYKIDALIGEKNHIQVVGDAQKFVVSPQSLSPEIPLGLNVPGLGRPVYLGRPKYLEALRRLSPIAAVFGDIGELELYLPNWLNIGTALVTGAYTPPWERHWFSNTNKSVVVNSLTEAVDFVLKQKGRVFVK